jgi:Fe-S-cluster containining protein
MPVEVRLSDLERLGLVEEGEVSPKRIARRLGREGVVRSYRAATGLFLLEPQSNGSCPFLGEDRLCTVYDRRPDLCRGFPLVVGPKPGFCPFKRKGNGRAP